MISDVLSQAIQDIDAYLDEPELTDMYAGESLAEIGAVRAAMNRLRVRLDAGRRPGAWSAENLALEHELEMKGLQEAVVNGTAVF
jgi:hypothetical protein